MDETMSPPSFLTACDPLPVELCNRGSASPLILLCEHAGQAVPSALGDLGLALGMLDRHIGWDIGAEALARAIADRLSAPLIIQRYSRLVMDCNRPPGSEESMPEISDGVVVPKNVSLTPAQKNLRQEAIFAPFNKAITEGFDRHPRRVALSIHSFTRCLAGQTRAWDAGFLSRADIDTANFLIDHIALAAPDLTLGLNQPYQIEDASDWFIPHHAEPRGLRHTLIEVCNDQLTTEQGVRHWSDLLSNAIAALLEDTE